MSVVPFLAMHLPDGFVSAPVALLGWLLTLAIVGVALRQSQAALDDNHHIPRLGILAACVFAAQMINFPVAGGTSGHLLGGTLVAILVGPWAAVLVMLAVIAVQGFMFQDGGLLAMGFNVFNMGILTVLVGHAVYRGLRRLAGDLPAATSIAAGLAAWFSVQCAAAATSLELVVSGTSPFNIALPAMLGIHALIGLGEALITASALTFIQQTRPDLMTLSPRSAQAGASWLGAGLLLALALALASPLASSQPDGLERVAQDHAFLEKAEPMPFSLLPDYTVPGVNSVGLTTIGAGAIGVLVLAGMGAGTARLTARRSQMPDSSAVQK